MSFSAALHPPVLKTPFHRSIVAESISVALELGEAAFAQKVAAGPVIQIPLSTISRVKTFDALINLRFGAPPHSVSVPLIMDTGNDTLIVPSFDNIKALPNFDADYKILSESIQEPFKLSAKLLQGPIVIPTPAGDFRIEDCTFFACTGPNPDDNTANFGAGWINQWRTFTDAYGKTFTVKPPLRTGANPYRYVEFDYAPAATVLTDADEPKIASGSTMTLLRDAPLPAYQMLEISKGPDDWWMSVKVKSLTIAGNKTSWPGRPFPMAMVDTGGGPVFLSDPDGDIYPTVWPQQVPLPDWANDGRSISCQAVSDPITIEIGDETNSFSYLIDTTTFPKPVQDLTLVLCKECFYMQGNKGMNIGGISALFNYILIDNQQGMVGFRSKRLMVA